MKSSKQNKNNKLKKYQNGAEFRKPAPFGNYTTPDQPQGTITTQDASFAPGVFSNEKANNTFTPFLSPLNIYDVNLNNSQLDLGPLTQGQYDERGIQNGQSEEEETETSKRAVDPYSLLTLGMGLTSVGLNRNQELQNRQDLYSSIQNRQSQPQYDYNYMYGRTTSGGTEYQPIVKAQMGAQINKRYNTPNSINNVEIEGGEYLQLPDMSTEMAYGPSHSNGGIQTSLPDGTKVFSNHMKPMGSKKTFAQMAKKYDNTKYDEILNNKFSKQVDKDTAMIMKQKNQKVLDKLFMDQQLMNGNSNGEPMAKYGASINNPGFKALPQAVQNKIISNMEYGGYSLPKLQDGDNWYTEQDWNNSQNGVMTVPDLMGSTNTTPGLPMGQPLFSTMQVPDVMGNTNTTPALPMSGPELVLNNNQNIDPQSAKIINDLSKSNDPKDKAKLKLYLESLTAQGAKTPTGKSSFARTKKVEEYIAPWKNIIPNAENMTEGDFQSSIYDYALKNNPESIKQMWLEYGLTNEGKKDPTLVKLTKDGKFDSSALTNENLAKLKKAYVDGKLGIRTLMPKQEETPVEPTPETTEPAKATENKAEETKVENQTYRTPKFEKAEGKNSGKYYRQAFPLEQAIPGIMGLANAQETFPYAIPEIDSPYLRPQTLNIQSQLQDIDNMGQASVRAGADPLSAYIAGIGGKEKAFQSKQNFDAQGRMQADMFNAQSQQRADMMNAQLFDRTYNNLIAEARDAATAEQQAAITSIIKNKAKYDQDENLKSLYLDNLQSAFEIGKDKPYSMTVDPEGRPVFNFGIVPKEEDQLLKKNKKTDEKSTKTTDVIPEEKVTTRKTK